MAIETRPPTADRRFYHVGGSLHADAPSYVERAADREMLEALSRGEYCYVLTSRQMGKSSLMVRTARRLQEVGVQVVVCDLTALGENQTAEQWYEGLLGLLGYRLDLEEELETFWLEHQRIGPLRRWMMALREVVLPRLRGPLVIFLDEIDCTRSLPFSTDEFFAAIRECYNRRTEDQEFHRLTFCLLGVATPSDLIRDTRKTPFNIGRRIELNDFSEQEAAPLAEGLLHPGDAETRRGEERERRALLERILHWTGGHPYLTQRLCQAVAEQASVATAHTRHPTPALVDRLCEALFLSTRARERDDNLIFVRERLFRSEADRVALLDLYAQVRGGRQVPDDTTNPLVSILRLSGITRTSGVQGDGHPDALGFRGVLRQFLSARTPEYLNASLEVRNRIYAQVFDREWVLQHMPDAEVRRQKTAYRRGLLRAASVGGAIVTLMTFLVVAAVGQAQRAEAASVQADREATTAKTLASRLRAALNEKQAALKEKERAYQRLRASLRAEQIARGRASTAEQRERAQRVSAERARREAVAQRGQAQQQRRLAESRRREAERERGRAVAARAESQERLVGLHVATGNRLVDEGDLVGALPWLAEALCLEEGNGAREALHRMRFAAVLQQCPRLVQVLPHNGDVRHAAFSPDGRRIVTASEDNTARVWNATGQPLSPSLKHNGRVWNAAFSPDGRRVVTASEDDTARVWDAASGQPLSPPLKHAGDVLQAAFSPDGRRIVTASGQWSQWGEARVWDAASGQPLTPPLKYNGPVYDAEFSPDGRRILTASSNGTAQVWDAATGQPLSPLLKHDGPLYGAAFSPDGRRVVTASGDKTARVWDAATGQPVTPPLKHNNSVYRAEFSPDGRRIVTASEDQTAQVWDAVTGQPLSPALKHNGCVNDAAFSPDGRHVLTASRDSTARVWDATTGQSATLSLAHRDRVHYAQFSPDGRRIITASDDSTARMWDAATGQPVTPPLKHNGAVSGAALSPDGRRVVTASGDKTARVWDAATGQPITPPLKHNEAVQFAVFSSDGRRVVTASKDNTARVWDATTGQPLSPPLKHNRSVKQAAFSPDGRRVLTASDDSTARVWDAATGQPVAPPLKHKGGVVGAAFSPNGRRVVTASEDNTARIWDAATDQPITPPLKHNSFVRDAAFSPDGRRIVTASGDGTARVWDATTGQPITPPLKHNRWLEDVAFSPDGRRIVTASYDGTARVWDLPTDPRPAADLRRLAQWLAGSRIDARAGSVPLDPAVARREEQALRAKYPADFAATPAQVRVWQEREAEDAERARE